MSRELQIFHKILLLFFTLSLSTYNSNGKLIPEGATVFESNGNTAILTSTKRHCYGQAFNNETVEIKNSSFSIPVLFGIVPEHKREGSHGMAVVISPTRGLPGASPDQYLGLFNETNNGKSSNRIIAIELDIHKDEEFGDINDNHVGININGLRSVNSTPAGYYDDKDGSFQNLSLISGKAMVLWIAYSQPDKQLNVTLFPAEFPSPPRQPLLSLDRDLSPYLLDEMYYGFTASTGDTGALHYVYGEYFDLDAEFVGWDLNKIPNLPPYPKKSSHRTRTILVVCLSIAVTVALVASGIRFLGKGWGAPFNKIFYLRSELVDDALEEWEIQNGPHRFGYKELFNATKGFKEKQLLGQGGFGQVYKGTLLGSEAEIAVKRTSHDSRQGMSEFLAEISTIGRLRHPNLVRLLGYCRRKEDLYLVYDFMPNGSLDKYLYNSNTDQNQQRLTWEQRFKIIKDVASALLHLHQGWVQVIIHRDIKPANVLMDHEMNARLGDFGLAKMYDQGFDSEPCLHARRILVTGNTAKDKSLQSVESMSVRNWLDRAPRLNRFLIPLEAERPMENDLVLELYLQPGSPLAAGFRLDAFNAIKPRVTHSPSSDVVDIWDPTSIIMEDRHVSPAILYIQVSVLQEQYKMVTIAEYRLPEARVGTQMYFDFPKQIQARRVSFKLLGDVAAFADDPAETDDLSGRASPFAAGLSLANRIKLYYYADPYEVGKWASLSAV